MPITGIRYPVNDRWVSILQNLLGTNYDVIEQGLPGRPAGNVDKEKPFKNGLEHFLSSVIPQTPIDILVIALGTNDMKSEFSRTAEQIFADLAEYNELVNDYNIKCKLIFLTPFTFHVPIIFDNASEKSKEIAKLFSVTSFDYLDLSNFEPKGKDRVHFTKEDHILYAKLVFEKINSLKN